MVNDQTFALPLAQPATTLSHCFQFQDFADIYLHKSLKKQRLTPPPRFSVFRQRSLKPYQEPDDRLNFRSALCLGSRSVCAVAERL